MPLDPVRNFAIVTVSTGYDSTATSIVLVSGDGSKLPDPATEGSFNLVWWNATDYGSPADDPYVEIVRCTAKSTDTLTITRAQEGTTAQNHNTSGKTYKMLLSLTKKTIDDLNIFINSKGAANGLASLDANSKVVQNPASATATPTAGKIPIADSSGRLFRWITQLINSQTDTTYTFVLSDAFKVVTFNNASTITVTVPTNASVSFPVGTQIDCIQLGAGKVTFSPASGVTIYSKGGKLSTNGQYVGVTLFKIDTDTWVLVGDLTT